MPAPLTQPHESVLGIDPGNFDTAYVLLTGDRKIVSFGKLPNADFVARLQSIVEQCPTRVAIEMVCSYGMAVGASVFETCVEIGRYRQLISFLSPKLPVDLVPRLEVKRAICHNPSANDANIRAALIDLFGPPGRKSEPGATYGITKDVWAALALAETARSGEYRPYIYSNLRA